MLLVLILLVTLIFLYWVTSPPRNYPPGPPCLPIIGSLPFIKIANFHLYLDEIRKKYGPVMGFKIGLRHTIGVTGPNAVKEVLTRAEFQGRPHSHLLNPGIMLNEGDFWSIQRKFAVMHLSEFGFGKKTVENVILEEANEFFDRRIGSRQIVQVSKLFSPSPVNVLWAMVAGKRFDHDDEKFNTLIEYLSDRFRSGNIVGGLSKTFPIVRKLFPNLDFVKKEIERDDKILTFFKEAVAEQKESKPDVPRGFIDVYLNELEKEDVHPSFSVSTLVQVATEIFGAGSESVGNTIAFALLYCVLYPDWQEKVYQEIKNYVENDSRPYLDGKKSLPKVEAFLSEASRCNPVTSLTVPHRAVDNTTLNGYFIPKDSMMLVSLWSVLNDKDYWKDPENFRPERFLNEDGTYNSHEQWLISFGMGLRRCPGEVLAKSAVFVFFIALIQKYKFSVPEGHPKPSTLCLSGFINAPQPFEVKVEERLKN